MLADADLPYLIGLAGDIDVSQWTPEIFYPFQELEREAYLKRANAKKRVVFALETEAARELIGCLYIDRTEGVGDIGCWIGRSYWGRGFGSEAVKRATRFAFEELEVDALDAQLMQGNVAAERVFVKAGFTQATRAVGTNTILEADVVLRYRIDRGGWKAQQAVKPMLFVVAAAMVDSDGRVLLAKRPEGKKLAGLWEFPGGKVNVGESLETALIRELKEELGIDTSKSCLAAYTFVSHEYEDFHLLMPLYICRVWKGTTQAREGQELAWVRPHRMQDYPMPPADKPLIAMLCDLL